MNIDCEIIEKEGFFALFNKKNNAQTEFEFTEIKPISDTHFSCCKENKYYLLGSHGKIMTKDAQQHYQWFYHDRILAKINNKYGFIDTVNRITIPFKYDEIIFNGQDFDVRIDKMWGVLNLLGREYIQIKYSEPVIFTEDGIAFVTDVYSGRQGVLHKFGYELIPTIYDFVIKDNSNPNYIYVSIGGSLNDTYWNFFSGDISKAKWGCYNINGKLILPVKYDCIKTIDKYLYGGWGGDFLIYGQDLVSAYFKEYSGVYDLYDNTGRFLIGGFHLFRVDKNVLFFHFGGLWREFEEEYNFQDYEYQTWMGKWVATDIELNSIIRLNGEVYNIAKNQTRIIPKYINYYDEYTKRNRIKSEIPIPDEILFSLTDGNTEPLLTKENLLFIGDTSSKRIVFVNEKIITDYFDEIEVIYDSIIYVRKDNNCGIINSSGFILNLDNYLITYPQSGYVITVKLINKGEFICELININDDSFPKTIIYDNLSLEMLEARIANNYLIITNLSENEVVKFEYIGLVDPLDDFLNPHFRKLIDPKPVQMNTFQERYWFPNIFKKKSSYNTFENDWKEEINWEEEKWDAMTDGMYGDYPGGVIDYDIFGF